MLPLLIVGPRGVIVQASPAADVLLGSTVGRSCDRALQAGDAQGRALCNPGCATAMTRDVVAGRDESEVRIRGRACRLVCTPMGSSTVIAILPTELTKPDRKCAPIGPLTAREEEVLALVAEGMTSRCIAEQLGIRPATVRTHVEHAREKLGAHTRAEAVARSIALRRA
jgi:DNA-binding CsgD family transcriptional regulator